jgi:hypothetical protein
MNKKLTNVVNAHLLERLENYLALNFPFNDEDEPVSGSDAVDMLCDICRIIGAERMTAAQKRISKRIEGEKK